MRLAISNFRTHCRVPPRSPLNENRVERIVRHGFVAECVRQLNSAPDSGAVVRIRRLPLKLHIKANELTEEALVRLWAAEFCRTLTSALALPGNNDGVIVKSESRAAWLARFISHHVSGTAQSRWEYEEFSEALKLTTVDGVLTVLQQEPRETLAVLQLLNRQRSLEKMLAVFTELAYEQLFAILLKGESKHESELTIQDLLLVGEWVPSGMLLDNGLATRHLALLIYLELSCREEAPARPRSSPRIVWYALLALETLVNVTRSWPLELWQQQLNRASLAGSGRTLNPTIDAVLDRVGTVASNPNEATRQTLAPLIKLLQTLANDVGEQQTSPQRSHSLSGECVGFLLLVGLILRFGWPAKILHTNFGRSWGNRAVTFFLAGLAQHLLSRNIDSQLDPGVAVLAGLLEPASASGNLLHSILSSTSHEDRSELLENLQLAQFTPEAASDWDATFSRLGDLILQEFASRIRGFRKATPAFIVKTFLKQPGHIVITDKEIHVTIRPSPFHVALHLSSIDEPIDSVPWLDNRCLQFHLEGL